MPLYEDLARRAVDASARSASLHRDARLIRDLAEILRRAHAGQVSIRRCAWCSRFDVGGEWLYLEAVGEGQLTIAISLLERATHGICPDCQDTELRRSEAGRAYLVDRQGGSQARSGA
jgi:predicted RNA-binding Zn-ribbon protein involved in translation (DUF1610 family)